MQCAQSNDKFRYASLGSEEVIGGTKMRARIAADLRTNALAHRFAVRSRHDDRRAGAAGGAHRTEQIN